MRGLLQTFLRTRLKINWRGQEKVPSVEDDTRLDVFDVDQCGGGGVLLEMQRQRLYCSGSKMKQQAVVETGIHGKK